MTATDALAGAGLFAIYVAVSALLQRAVPSWSPALISLGAVVSASLAGPLGAYFLRLPINLWRALAVYGFLALCFLMVFGAVYKSISLRMLLELWRAPAHRLSYAELLEQYVALESYQHRLGVILSARLATFSERRYVRTAQGRRIASMVRAIHRCYAIDQSG